MLEEEEKEGWEGEARESKNHNFRPSVRFSLPSPFRRDAHLAKPDDGGGDSQTPHIVLPKPFSV